MKRWMRGRSGGERQDAVIYSRLPDSLTFQLYTSMKTQARRRENFHPLECTECRPPRCCCCCILPFFLSLSLLARYFSSTPFAGALYLSGALTTPRQSARRSPVGEKNKRACAQPFLLLLQPRRITISTTSQREEKSRQLVAIKVESAGEIGRER